MNKVAFNKENIVSCGQFGIYSISDKFVEDLESFVRVDEDLYINIDEIKKTALSICNNTSQSNFKDNGSRMAKLSEVLNFVNDNICNADLSLKNIAAHFGCSASFISRIFLERYNMYYSSYINTQRIKLSLKYLSEGKNVSHVSRMCGFSSSNTFRRIFLKVMRVPPLQYKNSYL